MKTKRLAALLSTATFVLLTAPVFAAGPVLPGNLNPTKERHYQYLAETVTPAKHQGAVSAGGVAWQCSGGRCTAAGPWPAPGVGACKALAQQVGALKSYGHPQQRLGAHELQQCNSAAATTTPTGLKDAPKERVATAHDVVPLQGQKAGVATQPVAPPTAVQGPAHMLKGGEPTQQSAAPPPVMPLSAPAVTPNRVPPQAPGSGGFGPQPKPLGIGGAPQKTVLPAASAGDKKGGFAPKTSQAGTDLPVPPKDVKQAAAPVSGFSSDRSAATRAPGPVAFATEALTVTGTGSLTVRASFSPRSFTTDALTITGTGALTARLPFAPTSFTTEALTVTGTGALR